MPIEREIIYKLTMPKTMQDATIVKAKGEGTHDMNEADLKAFYRALQGWCVEIARAIGAVPDITNPIPPTGKPRQKWGTTTLNTIEEFVAKSGKAVTAPAVMSYLGWKDDENNRLRIAKLLSNLVAQKRLDATKNTPITMFSKPVSQIVID